MITTKEQFRQLQLEACIETIQLQEVEWDRVKEFNQELACLAHEYRQMKLGNS